MNNNVEKYVYLIWFIGIISGTYMLHVLFNVELDKHNRTALLVLISSFFMVMCSMILKSEKMLEYSHCILWISFLIVLTLSTNKYIISYLTVLHLFIFLSWILPDVGCILGNHSQSNLNIHIKNNDIGLYAIRIINTVVLLYGFYTFCLV